MSKRISITFSDDQAEVIEKISPKLKSKEDIKFIYEGTTMAINYSIPDYLNGDELYFHCAKIGHKLDSIKRNNKVSFCVIDKDEIIPEKFTTHYRSVIVFGKAKIVEYEKECKDILMTLVEKNT